MKRTSLNSAADWARPSRWADMRLAPRNQENGLFAGLEIGGTSCLVRLLNWSDDGACIDLPMSARIGDKVALLTNGMARDGSIRWIAHGRAGVEFGD